MKPSKWAKAAAVGVGLALFAAAYPAVSESAFTVPAPEDVTIKGDPGLAEALKQDISLHQYAQALELLSGRSDITATDDGFRLEIKLLLATKQTDKALALLEGRLAKDPTDAQSRFMVGEIQFRHGHNRQAALEYRLALAGKLDDPHATEALGRLTALSEPRTWRAWGGVTLSANSTVDGTFDDGRTLLVGLPVTLDDASAKKSAFTISGNAGAEKLTDVTDDLAVRTTLLGQISTGPAKAYDSESLALQVGPEWRVGELSHVSLTPRALIEWVGGKTAVGGFGLALHADTYGRDTYWTGQLNADSLNIRYRDLGEGVNTRLELRRTRYLNASSLWSVDTVVERNEASLFSSPFADGQVKLGRLFQAPWSSLVYIEGTTRLRGYDHDPLATGDRRTDAFGQVSFRFTKRDFVIGRGIPFITVSAARNSSNIDAYSYSRLRLDFGVTRGF